MAMEKLKPELMYGIIPCNWPIEHSYDVRRAFEAKEFEYEIPDFKKMTTFETSTWSLNESMKKSRQVQRLLELGVLHDNSGNEVLRYPTFLERRTIEKFRRVGPKHFLDSEDKCLRDVYSTDQEGTFVLDDHVLPGGGEYGFCDYIEIVSLLTGIKREELDRIIQENRNKWNSPIENLARFGDLAIKQQI